MRALVALFALAACVTGASRARAPHTRAAAAPAATSAKLTARWHALLSDLSANGALPLPLLVLPVPVSATARASTECAARTPGSRDRDYYDEDDDADEDQDYEPQPRPRPHPRPRPRPASRPASSLAPAEYKEPQGAPDGVASGGTATSQQLVELYRAQAPLAPHLPPALLDDFAPAPAPAPTPDTLRGYLPPATSPARPRFPRSLQLRAELSVPHADFTEPYTAWHDAASGAARVDFHVGGTSVYRALLPDGTLQRVEVRTDRTGEQDVVRCAVAVSPASVASAVPPALPDIELFSFAGYAPDEAGAAPAERWTRTVAGAPGEGGAARGEQLTFRHELLVAREAGEARPLRYSVAVDSSVLGADCEGYSHRYSESRAAPDPAVMRLDLESSCDVTETLDAADPEHMARLEPLREFTLPQRDPRHDSALNRFTVQFGRTYADAMEEAVRKALFVQHTRFVCSGNRQAASFELEVNFLGDRLDAELDVLLGVSFDDAREHAQRFPYSRGRLRELKARLPREFDWRPRGAVSPVRYQGSCSSCWAFAVTGSVEGARFIRTRQLEPLAEQCLVDCAHSHGAHGCGGTWPSHAYDYVQARGLPARAAYTPYAERVLPCRAPPVPPATTIAGYVNVPPNSTSALKVAIRRHAPSVVIVDAKPKSFMFYKRGVLRDERCAKGPAQRLNHAVLAVGWGELRGEPHFILKNSYSARWGDAGYIRLDARSNTCGVLSLPSYARLAPAASDSGESGESGEEGAVDSSEELT